MRYINSKQVTHIDVFQAIKGVRGAYGGVSQYTYLPERKRSFFYEGKREGYYQNGDYDSHSLSMSDVTDGDKYYVSSFEIYTNPYIKIYSGKDLIHTEYFFSVFTLQSHLSKNYPELTIHYTT